jgi:hypothetical protein
MSDEDLDDALRARLHDAIDPRVPGPASEERVLAAVTDADRGRAGWFGLRIGSGIGGVLAATLVVLVVGGALGVSLALHKDSGSHQPSTVATPPVIASSPSPTASPLPSPTASPAPTPSASTTGVQPCPADVLTARLYDQDGAAGTQGGDIALRNGGAVACTFEGYVNLEGVVDGRLVQLGVTHSVGGPLLNNSNGTLPTVRLVTVQPGHSAYFAYENSDVINGPTPCSSTQMLLITPPNDGRSVTLTTMPISLCGGFHATLWIDIAPVSSTPYYNTPNP